MREVYGVIEATGVSGAIEVREVYGVIEATGVFEVIEVREVSEATGELET